MKINIFWFRRDLRLEDNTALKHALADGTPVLPLFIFDTSIIEELPPDDPRVSFIYDRLSEINSELKKHNSSLLVFKGDPLSTWKKLTDIYDIGKVYFNKDYEPYAVARDREISSHLYGKGISVFSFKDQVIFEENEILTAEQKPYTIFTPYRKRWMQKLMQAGHFRLPVNKTFTPNYYNHNIQFPSRNELGFMESSIRVKQYDTDVIKDYDKFRDFPTLDRTSYLGPHLRFGTVSIRLITEKALVENQTFLDELIWREFFIQVIYHFPGVVTGNFRSKYDNVAWRNDEKEFERWCSGNTGYPLVDAGMRQLNETGYMHNRVRMITAGFLCKHLLTDWRWGEAYFALKLLDYELSSNNGNWQWAAGTGCDAAQYFRVFNPFTQQKRFDPKMDYIRKWIPEFGTSRYPEPMIDHDFARNRVIEAFRSGLV